jgi:hypothetical protein
MSGAAIKSHSRKRGAAEEGSSEDLRADFEATMGAAAAAPAAAAAGALGPAADAAAALTSASSAESLQQTHATAGVQPLPEQIENKPRCSRLDRLATVEVQLCLQFLDTNSKLKAARCSLQLLRAAGHPFAWQGPPVTVSSSYEKPDVGSRIRQSLLRHAPIALNLDFKLPAAEVAAIPRLRELIIRFGTADLALQLLALPSLRGLQTLRVRCPLPLATLKLLPTRPALHTLDFWAVAGSAGWDWDWLPAMPALTDLCVGLSHDKPLSPPLIDAIGQCTQLRSLQLGGPSFEAGNFARFCSTPALRQLRRLDMVHLQEVDAGLTAEDYRVVFSALAGLQSLRLDFVLRLDLLLPHLAHAPALRTLTCSCAAENPDLVGLIGSMHPGHEALRQLLTAAPRLEVRLEMATSIGEWRGSLCYSHGLASALQRGQMDDQWSELQRAAAELERVTVVEPVTEAESW